MVDPKPYSLTPHVTKCKRGHAYTDENSLWSFTYSGTPQRGCRACRNLRLRVKYNTDPAYREKLKRKRRGTS